MFANIDLFYFSRFIFKKYHKKATLQKIMKVDEELDCIDIQHVFLKKNYDILKIQISKKITVWCNFFLITT